MAVCESSRHYRNRHVISPSRCSRQTARAKASLIGDRCVGKSSCEQIQSVGGELSLVGLPELGCEFKQ